MTRDVRVSGHGPNRPHQSVHAPQPAEIAQAHLFEKLLQAEQAELQGAAHGMTSAGDRAAEAENSTSSDDLAQIRAGIEEVGGMLTALHRRFPRSPATDED